MDALDALHTAQFDWQTMFDLEFRFVYSLLILMNIRVEILEIRNKLYSTRIRSKIVKILALLQIQDCKFTDHRRIDL